MDKSETGFCRLFYCSQLDSSVNNCFQKIPTNYALCLPLIFFTALWKLLQQEFYIFDLCS